jgi:hypothetical protein
MVPLVIIHDSGKRFPSVGYLHFGAYTLDSHFVFCREPHPLRGVQNLIKAQLRLLVTVSTPLTEFSLSVGVVRRQLPIRSIRLTPRLPRHSSPPAVVASEDFV